MSGRRERTPGHELDSALRRYMPSSEPPGANGEEPSEDGPAPGGDGQGRRRREETSSPAITVSERRAPMATPRRLGEILAMARQSKGIELERAARDTKIRSHYLSALEAGDFRALPGTVYTKGFLRNYAQYLGLDPDVVVNHYNRELGGRGRERVALVARTLRAPRGGLTITPGLLVGLVLSAAIVAFGAYIAIQFMRFASPPEVTVTTPASVESTIDAETTTFSGTANPGATVTITGPDGPVTATADASGRWTALVPLRKGRNEFLIEALDPDTSKRSAQQQVIVMVPLPSPSPVPTGPQLALSSPDDGASVGDGVVHVAGTTAGSSVTVSAVYEGPPAGAAAPAEPPTAPEPKDLEIGDGGTFEGSLELAAGTWTVTVTSKDEEGLESSVGREVVVPISGVKVVVHIKGGRVWLRVRVDGELSAETGGGLVFEDGSKVTFKGKELVEIRSGVPGYTYVTVNGVDYGKLGGGNPGAWAIGPTGPPEPA